MRISAASHFWSLAAILMFGFTGHSGAQQLLARTPGLWQIDANVKMAPIGGAVKRTEKLCMTAEMARRDVAPPNALQEDGWKCSSKLSTITSNKASYAVQCKQGSDSARGTGEVVVASPQAFSGRTHIDAEMEGMKVTVDATYQAKFLAAACGQAALMKWEGFTELPKKK